MFLHLKRPTLHGKAYKKNSAKENDVTDENDFPPPPPFLLVNGNVIPDVPTKKEVDIRPVTEAKKKKEKKKKDRLSRASSDSSGSDTVRGRLKMLMLGRPSIETLQEKGIIKENVFGCPLDKLCAKELNTIPRFVKLCVEEIDRRGLDTDGLYRVSGNLTNIMKLRYLIDRDESVNLSEPQWNEIHLVTGALKMFLRELPEPIIPFNFFNSFIDACREKDHRARTENLRRLVKSLPRINYDTLYYLMQHFWRVQQHSARNRMLIQNIAIVFGPTLLATPPETSHLQKPGGGENIALNMHYQSMVVDSILTDNAYIFY